MTLKCSTMVRKKSDKGIFPAIGVVCRFINGKPVVQWPGDNLITMHEPDELVIVDKKES